MLLFVYPFVFLMISYIAGASFTSYSRDTENAHKKCTKTRGVTAVTPQIVIKFA